MMGSFWGHVLPGTFFIVISVWWTVSIFKRYFFAQFAKESCKSFNTQVEYVSTATFGCTRSGKSQCRPLESTFKLTCVVIGILGELVTGLEPGGSIGMHNAQHMTMFAFFGLNAFFDLMQFYRLPGLPAQLDYMSGILAFAAEGILFLWHLDGRTPMDIQVHTFLIYDIVICILAVALEMIFIRDVRPALGRAAFTLVQGTWFYQVAFILYPPWGLEQWDEESHRQMMLVTMMFTWHLAFGIIFQFIVGTIVYVKMRHTFAKLGVETKVDLKYEQLADDSTNPLKDEEDIF